MSNDNVRVSPAYWRLGESSGTTAADSSGNGNVGTYVGGVTLGQTGALLSDAANTAAALNGSSGLVDTGAAMRSIGNNLPTGASFECWYKTSSTARQTMGTSESSGAMFTFLDLNPSANTIAVSVVDQAGHALAGYATAPSGVISNGADHHYVTTVSGATLAIYLDGQPLSVTYTSTTALTTPAALAHDPYLGALNNAGTAASFCDGVLDEAALYPSVLSPGRVLPHYNAAMAATPWFWNVQTRASIRTLNLRGQATTATDAEGNLSVFLRYPGNDPDGDGQIVSSTLTAKQYGLLKETRVDADPNFVMSLVGSDGDLLDFVPGIIARANTPGVYQGLVTRNGGGSHGRLLLRCPGQRPQLHRRPRVHHRLRPE
jgi:hypothetical protein